MCDIGINLLLFLTTGYQEHAYAKFQTFWTLPLSNFGIMRYYFVKAELQIHFFMYLKENV